MTGKDDNCNTNANNNKIIFLNDNNGNNSMTMTDAKFCTIAICTTSRKPSRSIVAAMTW